MTLAAVETTWQNERKQYVRCRTIGHSWHDYDSNWSPQFGTPLTVRCERCGMERRDVVGRSGQLLARHYYRPKDYNLGRDEYKPSRDDFRLMLLAIRDEQAMARSKKRSTA